MNPDSASIGILNDQPVALEPLDPLTQAVRAGLPRSGLSAAQLAIGKLTGEVPVGIDAPTLKTRKLLMGGWALLAALRWAVLGLILIFVGAVCCYLGLHEGFDLRFFGFGISSLALAAVFARWAMHSARELRYVVRA